MEYKKIINQLDNAHYQISKFRTKQFGLKQIMTRVKNLTPIVKLN